MPKILSDIELDDLQEVTKAFLLITESRFLLRQSELSYKEFYEQVDDICNAFYNHNINDEAVFITKQLEEVGRSIKGLEKVFVLD